MIGPRSTSAWHRFVALPYAAFLVILESDRCQRLPGDPETSTCRIMLVQETLSPVAHFRAREEQWPAFDPLDLRHDSF
jgi:hypothetical protein